MINTLLKFLNENLGLVTLVAALSALLVYWEKNRDEKKKAARIILQEIRRAEDIIFDYKEHGKYRFTKKIIATNSWAKNIHHFVGDLDADELDRISNLYSTGEYLDSIIKKISDHNFDKKIVDFEKEINELFKSMQNSQSTNQTNLLLNNQNDSQRLSQQNVLKVKLPLSLPAPWKDLLDEITLKYEPIYHSTIVEKLKKIANLK